MTIDQYNLIKIVQDRCIVDTVTTPATPLRNIRNGVDCNGVDNSSLNRLYTACFYRGNM